MRPASFHPATKAVLIAGLLVAGALLFTQLTSLLIATLITVLVAIPLATLADRLGRRGVPRTVSVFGGLIAALALLGGILALVVPSLTEQTSELVEQIPSDFGAVQDRLGTVAGVDADKIGERVQSYLQSIGNNPTKIIGPLASIGLSALGALSIIVLILITGAYIAIKPQPLIDGALSLIPPDRRGWAHGTMGELRRAWIGWMQGVGIDMVTTGLLVYLGLTLVGLDFAVVFAVLSALLVVVPYFGAIVGGIPPVLVALADSPGKALIVLAIYVAIQQFEGNVLIPLVMADRANLHPALIAIGVVVVGQLFGFIGLFVAVPILSAIVILTREMWVRPMEAAAASGEPASADP